MLICADGQWMHTNTMTQWLASLFNFTGYYGDAFGLTACRACPEGTSTKQDGAIRPDLCNASLVPLGNEDVSISIWLLSSICSCAFLVAFDDISLIRISLILVFSSWHSSFQMIQWCITFHGCHIHLRTESSIFPWFCCVLLSRCGGGATPTSPHSTELSRLSKVLGPKVMSLQIRGDDIPISLDLRLNFLPGKVWVAKPNHARTCKLHLLRHLHWSCRGSELCRGICIECSTRREERCCEATGVMLLLKKICEHKICTSQLI